MDSLEGCRVLVTGGHGFIGTALVARLRAMGASVSAPARSEMDLHHMDQVCERMSAFQPQRIVHLAGCIQRDADTRRVLIDNVAASALMVAAAQPHGTRCLHVGTLDEYGDGPAPFEESQAPSPLTPYAASKAAAGLFTTMAGGTHVRLSLVYGPGQKTTFFVPQLLDALQHDQPFAMTAGEQRRDFIFLDDVVEGLVRLLACPAARGQVVNLCSGQGVQLKDLVLTAKKVAGRSGAVSLGALPYRPTEVFNAVGSTRKLEQLVGWRPATTLQDGLRLAAGT